MNRLAPRIVVTLIGLLVFVQISRADLTDGLVGYYSFDDGMGDSLSEGTGLGSDGELFNFDDDSPWVEGRIGGALAFDGLDDYVIAPESPLAESALTISIWGYANSAPTWASLVKNWGQGIVGQFHFGLGEGDADTLNVFVTQSDGAAFNAGTDVEDIEFEVWEHFAFVADPQAQLVTLYRNGEDVDERGYDGTFTPDPNSEAIGIGVKTNDFGDAADSGLCCPGYWDGMLDDLGIWHRALTADEIAEIYALGTAGQSFFGGNSIPGDFDGNGQLDAVDIDLLSGEVRAGTNDPAFDVTGDGAVNDQDRLEWVEGLKHTYFGDADLNLQFDSTDLVAVLASGSYEIDVESGWAAGDFDGNARTDSGDLVTALAGGGYEQGQRPAANAVPEPATLLMLLIGLSGVAMRRHLGPSHHD